MPNSTSNESGVNVNLVIGRNPRRPSISISTEPLTGDTDLRGNSENKSIRMRTRVQSDPGKSRPR